VLGALNMINAGNPVKVVVIVLPSGSEGIGNVKLLNFPTLTVSIKVVLSRGTNNGG
jgi:hypothetical protein